MSEAASLAFRLTDVSKVYRVYARPVDRVLELLGRHKYHRDFVALQPFSLDIRQGVSLGIVGDNGAGKSTLMHLLAGSHQPTSGTIERWGQVLGLLELGVGFHPEFTGRQNVFFYGDTLGLERSFVRRRLESILDFSELGEFIDQPLRTYSTGMRVRLAFALVASLEPDILIVDEALAVGDMHFQKKCIDRMTEFRRSGKTIVFCSHSLYQVGVFCDEVLWMQHGAVRMYGPPEQVLPAYEAYQMAKDGPLDEQSAAEGKSSLARISRFDVVSPLPMEPGGTLCVRWEAEAASGFHYHISLSLKMDNGRGVFVTGSHLRNLPPLQGDRTGEIRFPQLPLLGGVYSLHLRLWDDHGLVQLDERLIDQVIVLRTGPDLGLVRLPCEWQVLDVGVGV